MMRRCFAQGLQCVGDSLCDEVYGATVALFSPAGRPKGAFRERVSLGGRAASTLVYVEGVYVAQAHMGNGLGLELLRTSLHSLHPAGYWGDRSVALLFPAGDPPRGAGGSKSWDRAFRTLSSHFASIGFRACSPRTGVPLGSGGPPQQDRYMFAEPRTIGIGQGHPPSGAASLVPTNMRSDGPQAGPRPANRGALPHHLSPTSGAPAVV